MRARVSSWMRPVIAAAIVAAIGPGAGCGGRVSTAPLLLVDEGGYQLIVDRKPFRLRVLSPEGEERIRVDPGGLGIGRVETWSSGTNYDPFFAVFDFLNGPHDPPGGFSWVAVTEVTGSGSEDGEPIFNVRLSDGTAAVLRVGMPRDGVFRLLLDVPGATEENDGEPGDPRAAPAGGHFGSGRFRPLTAGGGSSTRTNSAQASWARSRSSR